MDNDSGIAATPAAYARLRDRARNSIASVLPLAGPFALNLETTNVCNFRCRMCPVSFADYEEQVGGVTTMPSERISRLFDELRGFPRLRVLRFHSEGEPLINKDLAALIRECNDKQISERTELTSNGSALTERIADALVDSRLTYLRVSIYGMTDERQRFVTQSKISVERIQRNVAALRRIRDAKRSSYPHIYVKMIDGQDAGEKEAFFATYRPIADEVELETPMDWNSYEQRDLAGAVVQLGRGKERRPGRAVCPYPFYSLVIKASGDVVACCVDWNKKTCVGNIHEQSLKEIWFGERLRKFRRMHLERRRHENSSCRNCSFFNDVPDDLDSVPAHEFERILG